MTSKDRNRKLPTLPTEIIINILKLCVDSSLAEGNIVTQGKLRKLATVSPMFLATVRGALIREQTALETLKADIIKQHKPRCTAVSSFLPTNEKPDILTGRTWVGCCVSEDRAKEVFSELNNIQHVAIWNIGHVLNELELRSMMMKGKAKRSGGAMAAPKEGDKS